MTAAALQGIVPSLADPEMSSVVRLKSRDRRRITRIKET